MELDDAYILDAVTKVVSRYGMKRTTMADIARAAGISRQTLYDRFGDKDGIMAAAIDSIADRVCTELRMAFAQESDLASSLDTYFRIAIWPTYEIVQAMPDAADFQKGSGKSTNAAIQRVADTKQEIMAAKFRQHLPQMAQRLRKFRGFSSNRAVRRRCRVWHLTIWNSFYPFLKCPC